MSRTLPDYLLKSHKWSALGSLNDLMNSFIKDSDPKISSKADKLSFWLETYSKYQETEKDFNSFWIPKLDRGTIVKVDFGFRIGREYGGLHYAVVINNDNPRSANVVTVIPLTSAKPNKPVNPRDVPLGNEIYQKLKLKRDALQKTYDENSVMYKHVNDLLDEVMMLYKIEDPEKSIKFTEMYNKLNESKSILDMQQKYLTNISSELNKMKIGSIALVEQITTVSKMRIHNPRKSDDILSGIKLSPESLDKLNNKIIELFVHKT